MGRPAVRIIYTAISSRLTPAETAHMTSDCQAKAVFTSFARREVATALSPERIPAVHSRFMCDGTVERWESYEQEEYGEEVKAVVQPVGMTAAGSDLERELLA
jgi:hypothetical protein